MLKSTLNHLVRSLIGFALSAVMIGCSGSSSDSPVSPLNKPLTGPDDCPNCEQVSFAARVQTINQEMFRVTFAGAPDTVFAIQNCEMFKLVAGHQVRVQFGDIQINDSVEVNGHRQANGDVIAQRLRIMASDGSCGYDLAFRDSIATIDYSAGTFTVYGRTETISIDENTVILGAKSTRLNAALSGSEPQNNQQREQLIKDRDTVLTFTDLQVGDVVEVRADVIDETNLLAIKVKLANCAEKLCITFDAVLATVDLDNNTVTFVDLAWVATVCPNAQLFDADGNELTLADFAAGDQVSVKGFPSSDGTLKICLMTVVSPV